MIRLPFGPLEREVGRRLDRPATREELVSTLGITTIETVSRYRLNGLTVWKADELAIKLNMHPVEIWGLQAWFEGISAAELDRDPDFPLPRLVEP